MINICVYLKNGYDSQYEDIELTKDDLKELACKKAKEKYEMDHWNIIHTVGDMELKTNF